MSSAAFSYFDWQLISMTMEIMPIIKNWTFAFIILYC